MIVFNFDDDRKFPLVSSLTTVEGAVRIEIVPDGTRKSLRIVTNGRRALDGARDIVLALPLHTLSGATERIELELSGPRRGLQFYVEGSDGDGVGLVWKLTDENEATGRRVLAGCVAAPQDRWEEDGTDRKKAIAQPLTFHRLRLTVSGTQDVDITLHELRLTGEVRNAPAGLSDA